MAVACKCDRCGVYFSPDNGVIDSIEFVQNGRYITCCCATEPARIVTGYDLCIACSESFKKWASEYEKEEIK